MRRGRASALTISLTGTALAVSVAAVAIALTAGGQPAGQAGQRGAGGVAPAERQIAADLRVNPQMIVQRRHRAGRRRLAAVADRRRVSAAPRSRAAIVGGPIEPLGDGEEPALGSPAPAPAADPPPPTCAVQAEPIGCPIQTITGAGAIQIGDRSYPRKGNWVRLLVLNPNTLTPAECKNGPCDLSFNAGETGALLKAIEETPESSDDIVILSGQGISYNPAWPNYVGHRYTPAQVSALKGAFEKLGGNLDPKGAALGGAESLDTGAWSLLGRAGAPGGFARQTYEAHQAGIPGFRGGARGGRGSLNGYLQVVNTAIYEFVSHEFIAVDTAAPGSSATKNIVTVGDRSYPSETIGPGEQAYHLVFLPNEADAYSPEPLHVINGTIVTRNADGSVNPEGVHQLASSLDLLRGSTVTAQLIGIVQSFGRDESKPRAEISNNHEWVDDELPFAGLSREPYDDGNYDYFNWCGTGEGGGGQMSGYSCETFPASPTSFGTAPTVTQLIGEMAGMRARNQVANLGYGSEPSEPEALAMIAPAHPYNDNDAHLAVGDEGRRLVGVLRRSRQSQWTVASAAPGLTDTSGETLFEPASLWEVAFGTPHEPWPLSGPPGSSLAEASRYLAEKLFPETGYTDVRQAYETAPAWIGSVPAELPGIAYPTERRPHFSRADFEHLKAHLATVEFPALEAVNVITHAYQELFGKEKLNGQINFTKIEEELITKALEDNEAVQRETATVDEGPSLGSALYFAADAIGAFGPETELLTGPLELFAGTYDFFSELYGSSTIEDTGHNVFGEPQMIRDEAAKLADDMAKRYHALSETFEHLETIFDTDWGRLRKAAQYATGEWALPPYSEKHRQLGLLQHSLAVAAEAGLYEAVVPLAYDQWVVSPWYTDAGGDQNNEGPKDVYGSAGPSGYYCHGPSAGPFEGFQETALAWVRFEADSAGGQKNHFTGRALGSKANPLALEADGESQGSGVANYPAVAHNGFGPDKTLTEKLFSPATPGSEFPFPDGLGLSKVEFLGMPSWDMPRLQCGMPLAYAVPVGE